MLVLAVTAPEPNNVIVLAREDFYTMLAHEAMQGREVFFVFRQCQKTRTGVEPTSFVGTDRA